MPLTARQERFCEEYLVDFNASAAAVRAGYSGKYPTQAATRLMRIPAVIETIQALRDELSKQIKANAEWLLQRLTKEATADLADLYDENRNLKPIDEWPDIWRTGLVQGIEVEELYEGSGEDRRQVGVLRKIKISDRLKRLELIGRHVGVAAFRDNVGMSGPDGGPVQVEDKSADAQSRLTALALLIARGGSVPGMDELTGPTIEGKAEAVTDDAETVI